MSKILLIEDDFAFCEMLKNFLSKKSFEVATAHSANEGKQKLIKQPFDLIISDIRLPDSDGIFLLTDLKKIRPDVPVILMTGYAEVSMAVEAMKKGAFDYISKPLNQDEVLTIVNKAIEGKANLIETNNKEASKIQFFNPLQSEASKILSEYISIVAPTDLSILISGESGTGKEVVAKTVHEKSLRSKNKFIAVDCGAIPKEIAGSELFGHLKGSFTGAIQDKIGYFEAANGGTLFLDEIGNLSYENQIQLLRALQERKIKPVGGNHEIEVDFRLIVATNEDLKEAVKKGDFREDLYHRLNEFSIHIPKLSERKEDLVAFAEYFLDKANRQLNKEVIGFSPEVLSFFKSYFWPGNIRELHNIIRRAVLLTQGDFIQLGVLPKEIILNQTGKPDFVLFDKESHEKEQIFDALKKTNFNKSKTATLLNISRKTLYNKLKLYKLG
ncbi:MAG: sigma-54-dependent Fis family transcriptional regulator [Flavobacteriales bacterium CG_4_9_14_3_um_filter_40_17]|nr:MAG: sigma-54-dependent Fis family transcriptional regulator [Flavobacteriales bacterium CG_4_9_14_3_um_filter_40_17]